MTIQKYLFLSSLIVSSFYITSCVTHQCEDLNCSEHTKEEDLGDCQCICYTGYEGNQCKKIARKRFLGTHSYFEAERSNRDSCGKSTTGNIDKDHSITIKEGATIPQLRIQNIAGIGENYEIKARMKPFENTAPFNQKNTVKSFVILKQTVGDYQFMKGTGKIGTIESGTGIFGNSWSTEGIILEFKYIVGCDTLDYNLEYEK